MTVLAERTALDPVLELVAAELASSGVPGLELAVVRDGEVLFCGGLGERGVGDRVAVGPDTLFHHGSCGKAFTGLLGALLAADGVVDLDAPVRRHVPELQLPDPVIADRVTIRDLLCHRSGLGRHDHAWIFNPSWSPAEIVGRLEHLPLVGDLRAQWSYSNFGFALAGYAMGRAAGTSWDVEVHRRIFHPLGMGRSRVTAAGMAADADHATPHVVREGEARPTLFRLLSGVAPAGEVVSCARDSARWLLAHLGESPLPQQLIDQTHQPQMLVPPGVSPFAEMEFVGYGLGWLQGTLRGRRLVWHNGGVDGFGTQTLLLPAQRIGILASANVFPTNLPLAVVLAIADALLGVQPDGPTWFEQLGAADEPADVPAQTTPSGAPPARDLAAYAGTYRHPGYGDITIGLGAGELTGRVGEFDVEATHRHYETWNLHYDPLDADLTITFSPDASGQIAGAEVAIEGSADRLSFARVESPEAWS